MVNARYRRVRKRIEKEDQEFEAGDMFADDSDDDKLRHDNTDHMNEEEHNDISPGLNKPKKQPKLKGRGKSLSLTDFSQDTCWGQEHTEADWEER